MSEDVLKIGTFEFRSRAATIHHPKERYQGFDIPWRSVTPAGDSVLVIGAGSLGKRLVESLQAHREYGFSIVGFLDDDPGKQQRNIRGVPVLGTTQDLENTSARHQVDQVMIALAMSAHHRIVQLIRRCGQLLVEIKVVPDLLQYYVVRAGTEELDGLPIINLTQIPLEGWNQIVKRAFDIVGAT